jgi:hypothetical protein
MALPAYIGAARAEIWLISPEMDEGLEDVVVHVFDSQEEEIDGSPFSCSPHPALPGVYVTDLVLEDAGAYLMRWQSESSGYSEDQQLTVVSSLTGEHSVVAKIVDEDSGEALQELLCLFLIEEDGSWVTAAQGYTNHQGYVTCSLGDGNYRLVLVRENTAFTVNGTEFVCHQLQTDTPLYVETKAIEYPPTEYEPPTTLRTMTAKIIQGDGSPLRFRDVSITVLQPAKYAKGEDFVVGDSKVVHQTDANGCLSIDLVPGAIVEVAVAGTRIARRFTVPDEDFSLFDYMEGYDYFDVIVRPYPAAEVE